MFRFAKKSKARVLWGQSNMAEVTAAAIASLSSNEYTVGHVTRGGVAASTWVNDDGTPTATFISDIAMAFSGLQFDEVAIDYAQGEGDVSALLAPIHAAKVAAIIRNIKAALGASRAKVVLWLPWKAGAPGIAEGYLNAVPAVGAGDVMRAGLVALAAANPGWMTTIDSRLWDRAYTEAGTISSSGTTVTGIGTAFQTAGIAAGHAITAAGQTRTVAAVASNTSLTTTVAFSPVLSGATHQTGDAVHVTTRGLIGDNWPYTPVTYPDNVRSYITAMAGLTAA